MSLGTFGGSASKLPRPASGGSGAMNDLMGQSLDLLSPSPMGQPAVPSQLILPSGNYGQNLLRNGSFEIWSSGTSSAPDGWAITGAGGSAAINSTNFQRGLAAVDLTAALNTRTDLGQAFLVSSSQNPQLRGNWVTASVRAKAGTANRVRIFLNDGVNTVYSFYHTGGGTFETLFISLKLDSAAGQLSVGLQIDSGSSITATFDGAILIEGTTPVSFSNHPSDPFSVPRSASATSTTTTVSASYVDLDSMSIANIIVDGTQSVFVFFNAAVYNDNAGGDVRVQLVRGSTQLVQGIIDVSNANVNRNMSLQAMDSKPAAGNYTYKAQFLTNLGTAKVDGRYISVAVYPSI